MLSKPAGQRSLRQVAKEAAAKKAAAVPSVAKPEQPLIKEQPPAQKEPGGLVTVTAKCGHVIEVPAIKQFKAVKKICSVCHEVKMQADKEAYLQRKIDNPETHGRRHLKSRLPIGSIFHVTYVKDHEWDGTLTIGDKTFLAQSNSVFGLLVKLDRRYRLEISKEQCSESYAETSLET